MARNPYLVGFRAALLASSAQGVEAKDLARAAGISLRVAQKAFVLLGEAGALVSSRQRVGLQGSHPRIWRLPKD